MTDNNFYFLTLKCNFMLLDRVKMYTHKYMDPEGDNKSLQRKVQFDIRLYFARRGAENMEKMQVNDFQLFFDQKTEGWFVKKVKDELTKNHRKPEQIVSGIMPENRDDPLCPVKSFRKYLEHLSPKNTYLRLMTVTRKDSQTFGTLISTLGGIYYQSSCLKLALTVVSPRSTTTTVFEQLV